MNFLIAIDQLFNALAGGNPDVTISSHVYGCKWHKLVKMIDYTFSPIEIEHCLYSFLADSDKDFTDNYYRTALFAIIGCIILFLPIRIIKLCQR